jgi:ABC-type multidrug transport system fused ATPase/permease subunit
LLLRLLTPTTGDIFLDGVDIRKLDLADWRRHLGYVSQDIFLINDTIENNIKFYDQTITTEQVVAAAKMANIYDFVLTCPQGLQTVVGERGMMLSAGQRQRLVIARILARQPHILILDEATSALDRESELKIQEVIRGLRGKVTVLVIAHRLSTITNADRLLAIEDGRIVEEGVPQQLLADKESYFYRVMSKTSSHLI